MFNAVLSPFLMPHTWNIDKQTSPHRCLLACIYVNSTLRMRFLSLTILSTHKIQIPLLHVLCNSKSHFDYLNVLFSASANYKQTYMRACCSIYTAKFHNLYTEWKIHVITEIFFSENNILIYASILHHKCLKYSVTFHVSHRCQLAFNLPYLTLHQWVPSKKFVGKIVRPLALWTRPAM